MRACVVSGNRLAGLGIESVARRLGVAVRPATLQEAVALGGGVDVTLLYADAWDGECRRAADRLHANRQRFIVVAGGMDVGTAMAVLASGALHACRMEDEADLSGALEQFLRAAAGPAERFVLANTYIVDLSGRRVHRDGCFFDLSGVECRILSSLHDQAWLSHAGPMSLPRISFAVYGSPDEHAASTVRVHIHRLRGKIEVEPDNPAVLVCQRGRGYRLVLAAGARSAAGAVAAIG